MWVWGEGKHREDFTELGSIEAVWEWTRFYQSMLEPKEWPEQGLGPLVVFHLYQQLLLKLAAQLNDPVLEILILSAHH